MAAPTTSRIWEARRTVLVSTLKLDEKKNTKSVFAHLSHHDREGENSNKVVDELEHDLKQGGGVGQPPDGDQALHRKVVTADVTGEGRTRRTQNQHTIVSSITCLVAVACVC